MTDTDQEEKYHAAFRQKLADLIGEEEVQVIGWYGAHGDTVRLVGDFTPKVLRGIADALEAVSDAWPYRRKLTMVGNDMEFRKENIRVGDDDYIDVEYRWSMEGGKVNIYVRYEDGQMHTMSMWPSDTQIDDAHALDLVRMCATQDRGKIKPAG